MLPQTVVPGGGMRDRGALGHCIAMSSESWDSQQHCKSMSTEAHCWDLSGGNDL
jgi:uncharacterized protein YfiM (DUF2279 family)